MNKRIAILLSLAWLVTSSFLPLLNSRPASAVTAADWRAGNIINDTLFADGAGMSVAQIQNFLQQRLPFCDTWGTKPSEYGGGTRAQYGASVGNPAPFTCITNYYEVPKTTPGAYLPANNYGRYNADGSTYIPAGSKSAAQLIYDAAQQYSINPKALLIKLATESKGPLTSDQWPLQVQYYYAMGAHCPDSGPGGSANCDVNYSGFSMQISEAASLLRSYLDGMTQSWWPYKKPFQVNRVLWNTTISGCGAADVYIETKATAALYTYTPYQPNAAALNNMYGYGDGCSAYGNRNFWRVWNDWFGSTQDPGYTPFFQFPGSVATYILGANNTYYYIPTYDRLKDYGFESIFKNRLNILDPSAVVGYTNKGDLPAIARFEGTGVFVASAGALQPFPSEQIFFDYGYTWGQEATLQKQMGDVLPQGTPIWNIAAQSDGSTTYYVGGGVKRAMCNYTVFTQLGSPIYSTQPITRLRTTYLNTVTSGGPIAMEGDVIESWGTGDRGVWQNGLYTPIDPTASNNIGNVTCGAPTDAVNKLPRATTTIGSIAKSSSTGAVYVFDQDKKLAITSTALGLDTSKATAVTDTLLAKLADGTMGSLVRVNNTAGVYVLTGGKRYAVPSENDLYGLGYSFSQVQNITSATFNLFADGGYIFRPNRLIREAGSLGVYLVDENFVKHPITSEQDFYNYGFSWSQVDVIGGGAAKAYTDGAPLSPYIKENDTLYWLMNRGVKRRIPIELTGLTNYNLTTSNTSTLPVSVLKNYPMTTQALTRVFRSGTTPAVYMIENGQKRAFTSEQAFFNAGFTWSDVISLNPSTAASIPTGSLIY